MYWALNKKLKVCLGWHENPPIGHVRDEGLHTFLRMIRYCWKDNGEEQFEFVHHNVLSDDMIDEKMEYVKFVNFSFKNRLGGCTVYYV
jgi:hypothetical protein